MLCICIDGQVRLVRLILSKQITSICFFVNKRTNYKIPFADEQMVTRRIKENHLFFLLYIP
jgi:hypothetical protein